MFITIASSLTCNKLVYKANTLDILYCFVVRYFASNFISILSNHNDSVTQIRNASHNHTKIQ